MRSTATLKLNALKARIANKILTFKKRRIVLWFSLTMPTNLVIGSDHRPRTWSKIIFDRFQVGSNKTHCHGHLRLK